MSPLFPRHANLIARLSLAIGVFIPIVAAGLGYYMVRSPMVTEVGVAKAQPIPFSHRQHVGDFGLDCRYCHIAVEASNTASIPATETCMGCHVEITPDSPNLELVRASLDDTQPLEWIRVHSLPDYVYFNHAIHVTQGIGCETCHGRVDQMDVVAKAETLQMTWCLDCHREPDRYIRPRDQVFTMGWTPDTDQAVLGPQLVAEYGIHVSPLADCSVCHR